MRQNRIIYTLLSIGLIGAFAGHGAFAIDGKEAFNELLIGSMDNVLGVNLGADTATDWVAAIGWFDVTLAAVVTVMLVGNIMARGPLYRFAYSPVALVLYSWAVIWGFVTAASRMTGAGAFMPEFWDLVERAPNFMLPATLVYLVYHHRLDHRGTATTLAGVEQRHRPTPAG